MRQGGNSERIQKCPAGSARRGIFLFQEHLDDRHKGRRLDRGQGKVHISVVSCGAVMLAAGAVAAWFGLGLFRVSVACLLTVLLSELIFVPF